MTDSPAGGRCSHCHNPIPAGAGTEPFCCHGCAAVHALLVANGLTRYYELAGASPAPVPVLPGARSFGWLEPLLEPFAERPEGELCTLRLDIQGVHCAACVWLLQETFRRRRAGGAVTVNPALGQLRLTFRKGGFDVVAWLAEVEAFGYRFGPARKRPSRASIDLPLRLGISAALTANAMLFSVSFYFGLDPSDPEIFRLFTWLSVALSSAVVAIGGWPFLAAAWRGLRRGVLHLDLPIAVGILLVYLSSLVQLRDGRGDLGYFDTLDTFITLMLAGRFLQVRLVERNRRFLLEDDGAEGIYVRVLAGGRPTVVAAAKVRAGDALLVAPGDLVPVDARLDDAEAAISTDWVSGESEPQSVLAGGAIAAGSFNAGRAAFHATAQTDFASSPLVDLLRQPPARDAVRGGHRRLFDRLARGWVSGVVAAAGIGFLAWLPQGLDQALAVAAALLVVTCPCAIGIAIPLAYELTHLRLRRAGFFARGEDLLDRLTRVRKLLFDKTGTLTLGRLVLADPRAFATLDRAARTVAYNLAVRSGHPVAQAVADALAAEPLPYDPAARIHEEPGAGIEWRRADGRWRLGSAVWAAGQPGRDAVLARDGVVLARLEVREALRVDAREELAALARRGYEIWLLSGDSAEKVAALAGRLDLAPGRALGALSPADKAATVARLDADDALFLGDGVNDALAFERAFAAGTPAIDRPVMPGKSDFFLTGEGLASLAAGLDGARALRRVVRRLIGVSIAYNALVIAAALAGWVSPVVAAIAMPASTLTLLALTVFALAPRRLRAAGAAAALPLAEARA